MWGNLSRTALRSVKERTVRMIWYKEKEKKADARNSKHTLSPRFKREPASIERRERHARSKSKAKTRERFKKRHENRCGPAGNEKTEMYRQGFAAVRDQAS